MKQLIPNIALISFLGLQMFSNQTTAQDTLKENKAFYSFEVTGGRIVPNYLINYPSASIRSDVKASIIWKHTDKSWSKYYNTAETGVTALFSHLGNPRVFGNQVALYPFLRMKLNEKPKPWYIQFTIGATYFNKPYDSITNTTNLAVGSHFTWHFSTSLYKTLAYFNKSELRLSGGFFHASNGHIQIPNFGLNSGTIGLQLVLNPRNHFYNKQSIKEKGYWALEQQNSIGIHELAGTASPRGGKKYYVRTHGLNGAYIHNNHFKIKSGFTYRYYDSYFQYMKTTRTKPSVSVASNVYFMAGVEFLFGHIGIDIEGGLNLYKPFFEEYYFTFDDKGLGDYWSKKLFNTKMGLNYYLIDTHKQPKFNVRVGAQINANFGTADFSSASLGFVYKL